MVLLALSVAAVVGIFLWSACRQNALSADEGGSVETGGGDGRDSLDGDQPAGTPEADADHPEIGLTNYTTFV